MELDIGEKGNKDMNKKIVYSEAPSEISNVLNTGIVVEDFLPPPDRLIKKTEKVKVTISLNSNSIDFFKKCAKKNNVKYQTMINEILDQYAQRYREYSLNTK